MDAVGRKELEQVQNNPGSSGAVVKFLKVVRDNQLRVYSGLVVKYGSEVLKTPSVLGADVWNVYEQVLVAALDIGNFETAQLCLDKLDIKFPGSVRVQRLSGMLHEARGEHDKAVAVYDQVLKAQPLDEIARHRKVAVLKSRGDTGGAVRELVVLLKDRQGDLAAWKELGSLYLRLNLFAPARFCMEEMTMAQPYNHVWFTLCAEILYTMGTTDSLQLARKYYAHSVNLFPAGLRALYGLVATTQALAGKNANDKDNGKLYKVASAKIVALYLSQNTQMVDIVTPTIAQLSPDV